MATEAPPTEAGLGERVLVKDKGGMHSGLVRYLGRVEGQQGRWAGIEWDDPERGKHDGSFKGHRYFTCSRSPARASFVKIDKVKPGASLHEEVHRRYTPKGNDLADMTLESANYKRFQVAFRGMEKLQKHYSHMSYLTSMTLDGLKIARSGDLIMLASAVPNVTFLSLTNNLLSSWPDTLAIARGLPSLQTLEISHNLMDAASLPPNPLAPLPNLRVLVANSTATPWSTAMAVCAATPMLMELYLSNNNIEELGPGTEGVQGSQQPTAPMLCSLDLSDNRLPSWHALDPLYRWSLTELKLSGNPLGDFPVPKEGAAGAAAFIPSLAHVYMANCGVTSWATVDVLAKLPNLRDLRLSSNPVEGFCVIGARIEAVARIGTLTRVNGGDVSTRERRDCELRYLSYVRARVAPMTEAAASLEREQHPRLAELEKEYGPLEDMPVAVSAASGGPLGDRLVSVTFVHVNGDTTRTHTVRLPMSIRMARIKLLCSLVFRVDVAIQELWLQSGFNAGTRLDADDTTDVAYWELTEGDVVHVKQAEADRVWKSCAGFIRAADKSHWLLPPELRPELASMVADGE